MKDAAPVRKKGSSGEGMPSWLSAGAFAAALVLLGSLAFVFFLQQPAGGNPYEGGITLSLQSHPPFLEGEGIALKAYSTCGDFGIYSDGQKLKEGASGQEFRLALAAGLHEIVASNGRCSSRLQISVQAEECVAGQERNCTEGACGGTQECERGSWGLCTLPPRVCSPGSKVGCSTDACSFGYATCNPCGTGFGQCLPPGMEEAPLTGNSISCG